MLIASASPLPQLPSLAPPADGPAPDTTASSHSFARLLAQRREQAAAPAPQADQGDAGKAPSREAAERARTGPEQTTHHADGTAQSAPRRGAPAHEAGKGREAGTRPCGAAARHGDAKAEAVAADAAAGTSRSSKGEAGTVDPALADWLARLQLPDAQQPAAAALPDVPVAAVTPPAAAVAETSAAATGDAAVALQSVAGGSERAAGQGDLAKPAALPDPADLARPVRNHGEGQQTGADAGDEPNKEAAATPAPHDTLQAAADKPAASLTLPAPAAAAPMHLPALPAPVAAQALVSAQPVAAAPGHDPARPLPVVLGTPLAAPEFPQAMGMQIGVLARNGIEHAELQLNPAEMGPVSVRIVVEGTQARVDFGADLAATRQAIEASLPELAGALREAGFTLTGGGVSQHAHPRRDGGGQGQTGSGGTGARGEPGQPGDSPAAPQRRTVRAGGVDLYA